MAQFTPHFVVLVAALLITFSDCSAENVYCVIPTATSCSSCPHNSTHCATLSEYVQNAVLYFTSNSTLVFLPGDHALDTNITVANVVRLAMRGESSPGNRATVVCSGQVGLSFTSMMDFKIDSLAFTSCSRGSAYFKYAVLLQSAQRTELVNCSFHDNLGTALVVKHANVTLAGKTEFMHNNWCFGGGIKALSSNLTFTGNTTFLDNHAVFYDCLGSGGAILALSNTVLSFSGINNFINNSSPFLGGAISAPYEFFVLSFNGINNFVNNSADNFGGAIFAPDRTVLNFSGTSNFINNFAQLGGGAIFTQTYSKLTFNGTVNFTNNVCRSRADSNEATGGGVYLGLKCTFATLPNTTVYWENNHAMLGGAIYVRDGSPVSECPSVDALVPKEECFFQLPGQNLSKGIDVQLVFKNNSADVAGSVLYGGAIDDCKLTGLESYNSGEVFDILVRNYGTDFNTTSNISSDPLYICPCENNVPDCSKSNYQVPRIIYPGETFQVSVVAVGQRHGTVSSPVISSIDQITNPGETLESQYLRRRASNTCTKLSYAVSSLSQNVVIDLRGESNPCGDELDISVSLNPICPPGFNISESKSCVCEPRLAQYTLQCNITNGVGQITRDAHQQFWVGYDNQSDEIILHPLCPFDYCVNYKVTFPLNITNLQCAYNRSGLLCGQCKKGYSLVLSTSDCKKCTNIYLVLIIPFMLMGVALVFLLLVCKLTVATGTLSGLVFYANVIGVNHTTVPLANPILSVFIAWLNLDFGIETCFYNGMDAYSKTWLQFVFPMYIWVLVGLMILVSHYSRRFSWLLGNNPVSVLATLILLSYAKILRTLINVFYVTYLEYPKYNRSVWLYDANIDYLSGKHIPLFLVAVLVFLFLFLPYTLLLLFGQWLKGISHVRFFSWVNSARLKAFMDSYHAPYKPKHRYWPGLLLVLRFVYLLVFALNPQQDPSINLLAILVTVGFLVAWAWVSGGVYENRYLDALECSFALNLIILVGGTCYVELAEENTSSQRAENQIAVGHSSVSIAFATFLGILVFQLANVTGISQYLERKCMRFKTVIKNIFPAETEGEPLDNDSLPDRLINPAKYEQPFHTPQGHTNAEPPGAKERLITPVYTYGSMN